MKNTGNGNKGKKIIIAIAIVIVLIILLFIASDYIIFDKNSKMNLVINNNNITKDLKQDIIIEEDGTIYLSEDDIRNFFDNHIYEVDNKIVTTYDKKIAEIGFSDNELNVNGSTVEIKAHAKKIDNNQNYLPISEMKDVYGIEIEVNDDTKVITIDSTDRELKKCTVTGNEPIKSSTGIIGKTIARVKKGSSVIKIDESKSGWSRVRTENGKVGYIKTKKLDNEIVVRENMGEEKQIEGKVDLVWDYFSESDKAPNRNGTQMQGVNVVSPAFIYLNNKGEVVENIGDAGQAYINWAHDNGYKVWPIFSNNGDNMMDVTSEIMNDYEKRKQVIEEVVKICVKYKLDGINVDFENMKAEDKDLYSRFIIEMTPRIKEIGNVMTVDVTAPDGGETWSMCFDRHTLGDVVDYIVFMAYDEYGVASEKAGTTAGYDWVKLSLEKFLNTEEIESERIILGIPFYTRLWKEESEEKAISEVMTLKDIKEKVSPALERTWDDNLKQHYLEYERDGAKYKMWLEDEQSIEEKVKLIPQYNLAGVAAWAKDMETDNIWGVINENMNK